MNRIRKYISRSGIKFLLPAVFALVSVVSCARTDKAEPGSRGRVSHVLSSAESLLGNDDSTALALLESINPQSVRTRRQNALYALLYSEALYKNYITAPDDSLIMIAVRYYSSGKDVEKQFRSLYMLGCIYTELGLKSNALVALTQAEHYSRNLSDIFRIGLLDTQLGNSFFYSYDFVRASSYYEKARSLYLESGHNIHYMHALYDVACCQLQLGRFKNAHDLFESVELLASESDENLLLYNCLLNKVNCSLFLNDLKQAETEMSYILELFDDSLDDAVSLSVFAKYNILTGDLPKAEYYIDKGWKKSSTISDSISMFEYESMLLEKYGSSDSALVKSRKAVSLERRNVQTVDSEPLIGTMSDLYKNIAEIEMLKVSRNRLTLFGVIVLFSVVIIMLSLLSHLRREIYYSEKQSMLLTIRELRLKEDSKNETIKTLNPRVNSLFGRPLRELNSIVTAIIETEDNIAIRSVKPDEKRRERVYHEQTDKFYVEIKKKFDQIVSDEYQKELDCIINASCSGIMDRISKLDLSFSDKNLLILRMSIAGFSPKSIHFLSGIPLGSVYQQRIRAIAKIKEVSVELAQTITEIVDNR